VTVAAHANGGLDEPVSNVYTYSPSNKTFRISTHPHSGEMGYTELFVFALMTHGIVRLADFSVGFSSPTCS